MEAEPRPQDLEMSEALAILREMAKTGIWQDFCRYLDSLLVRARDELEACDDIKQVWITQGGIRMLREIRGWREELLNDVARAVAEGESHGEA